MFYTGAERRYHFNAEIMLVMSMYMAAIAIAALDLLFPIEVACRTLGGGEIQGWTSAFARRIYPFALSATVVFSFWCHRWTDRLVKSSHRPNGWQSAVMALRPLSWLPVVVLLRHSAGWFGTEIPAFMVPLGIPLILACCFVNISYGGCRVCAGSAISSTRWASIVFLASFTFYLLFQIPEARGKLIGGGDVCHYEIQLRSLVESGSLDITDEMNSLMRDAGVLGSSDAERVYIPFSHARRNGNGRIYSVHGYGYPLLAWPFALVAGALGVSLLNIFLGATAATGIFVLCRRCGASLRSSLIATALLATSFFWTYTVLSHLPEMLGCTLCIWACWSVFAQSDPERRIAATISATVAIGYLPLAHFRFVPIAAILLLAFVTEGVLGRAGEARRNCAFRIASAFAIAIAVWMVAFFVHRKMFAGVESFTFDTILFAQPVSMLGIFTDQRGINAVFPVIWILAWAPLLALGSGRETRRMAILSIVLELATILFCCANEGAIVGSCIAGRYYLQAIPALVPFGALYLDRSGLLGKTWFCFLGILPVLYLLAVVPHGEIRSDVFAPMGMWNKDVFQSFWMPYVPLLERKGCFHVIVTAIMPAAMVAVSILLHSPEHGRARAVAALIFITVGIGAGLFVSNRFPYAPAETGAALCHGDRWHEFVPLSKSTRNGYREAFVRAGEPPRMPLFALGTNAPALGALRYLDPTTRKPNDSLGRPLVWTPLRIHGICANGVIPGRRCLKPLKMAVRVSGAVNNGTLYIAYAKGDEKEPAEGIKLGSGPFDMVLLLEVRPEFSHPSIFGALGGIGDEAIIERMEFYPYAAGLEKAVGAFPDGAQVMDILPKAN